MPLPKAPQRGPAAPPPPAAPAPPPRAPTLERTALVQAAQEALANFWSTPGMLGADAAIAALRQLTAPELALLELWVPDGNPGSPTALRCARAREFVRASRAAAAALP